MTLSGSKDLVHETIRSERPHPPLTSACTARSSIAIWGARLERLGQLEAAARSTFLNAPIDGVSTRAKVLAMAIADKQPISPIGKTSEEAASERYERDAAYREAHERLAPYRAIARAVILARVARHLTQRDVAGMLGTTDSAISRIESGERAVSLETLRKLGVALDIVFLVGSTSAAIAAATDPRAVVVPEAAIETASGSFPGSRAQRKTPAEAVAG